MSNLSIPAEWMWLTFPSRHASKNIYVVFHTKRTSRFRELPKPLSFSKKCSFFFQKETRWWFVFCHPFEKYAQLSNCLQDEYFKKKWLKPPPSPLFSILPKTAGFRAVSIRVVAGFYGIHRWPPRKNSPIFFQEPRRYFLRVWSTWAWSSVTVAFRWDHLMTFKNQSFSSWWLNQPSWKICSSKWESSPSGVKIKNIWNHHLVLLLSKTQLHLVAWERATRNAECWNAVSQRRAPQGFQVPLYSHMHFSACEKSI